MIKGIYSSEASMRPKMTRLEVLANNLANMHTTGYKRDRVFVQMLKESADGRPDGRGSVDGVGVDRYVDMTEGPLRQTDNPLDLAMQGAGFFVIETPRGARYTRNGNFTMTTDGTLVTAEGYRVLGTEGEIRFPKFDHIEKQKIKVAQNGEIMFGDDRVGQLRMVTIENPELLQKDHQSLLMTRAGQKVSDIPPDQMIVRQGFLEESNVNGIEEMIAMIELSRNFETDQRVIRAQDTTLDRSLEVGRV
jgi:flagellar basal-body rod protein FlgF